MTTSGEEPDLNAIGDNHMPDDVRQSVREEHEVTEQEDSSESGEDPDRDPDD